MRILVLALLALCFAGDSFAADGAYDGDSCSGSAKPILVIRSGSSGVFCPVTTTTQLVRVTSAIADWNWNADTTVSTAGSVTLTFKKCSGATTAANDCKNLLTDSTGNSTITSGSPTGSGWLSSGLWLVTASGAATNGILLLTGR